MILLWPYQWLLCICSQKTGDLECCVSFFDRSYLEKENWRANNDRLPPKRGLPPWKLGRVLPSPFPAISWGRSLGTRLRWSWVTRKMEAVRIITWNGLIPLKVTGQTNRRVPGEILSFRFRKDLVFHLPAYNFLNLVSAWFWRCNMWLLTNSASIWYKTPIFRYLEPYGSVGDLAQALTLWLLAWRDIFSFLSFSGPRGFPRISRLLFAVSRARSLSCEDKFQENPLGPG